MYFNYSPGARPGCGRRRDEEAGLCGRGLPGGRIYIYIYI